MLTRRPHSKPRRRVPMISFPGINFNVGALIKHPPNPFRRASSSYVDMPTFFFYTFSFHLEHSLKISERDTRDFCNVWTRLDT